MSEVYAQHRYLLSSANLYAEDKEFFESVLSRKISNQAAFENKLKNLRRYLYRHHTTKTWALADEYDTPIQAAHIGGYYERMLSLIHGLLSSVLKSNANLNRSVITGILRVAKESLFSSLNNVNTYSLLQSEYSSQFGFTE